MTSNILEGTRWFDRREYRKAIQCFDTVSQDDPDFEHVALLKIVATLADRGGVEAIHYTVKPNYYNKIAVFTKSENPTVRRRAFFLLWLLLTEDYFKRFYGRGLNPSPAEVEKQKAIGDGDTELFAHLTCSTIVNS